jgi:hypothetical protein
VSSPALDFSALRDFLLAVIIIMLHELGMNNFVSVMFANADQSCKASDHRLSLRCFFVVWVPASSTDVPPVEQAVMPKFEVKSMPPVPATAEVPPVEMDGISKLKVEVLSPTPEPMVRFVATEDRLGPPLMLTAPVRVRRVKLTDF